MSYKTRFIIIALNASAVYAANTDVQEIPWYKKGVWTARLHNRQVIPDTITRLGPEGTFFQPMMNPDGNSVVFWGKEDQTKNFNIWISAVDGSNCRPLTSDGKSAEPAWTPDGKTIFYSSAKNSSHHHIWAMDADGKNQHQLTEGTSNDSRPCVSPDGKTIVFVSNRSGDQNLWKSDLNGTEPVQITKHEGIDFKPCFSPDGRFLAYHSGYGKGSPHNLTIMKWPDGKPYFPVKLKEGEWLHGPFWTPDGKHVLVHGYMLDVPLTRLFIVDVDSGNVSLFPIPGFERWGTRLFR